MKLSAYTLGAALFLSLTTTTMAADINAGKSKASICAACHGVDGISLNPVWPNLAGQKEVYLAKQLKAFKDGSRNDPMMSPQAKALSDQDMADLAAYFSSLK